MGKWQAELIILAYSSWAHLCKNSFSVFEFRIFLLQDLLPAKTPDSRVLSYSTYRRKVGKSMDLYLSQVYESSYGA